MCVICERSFSPTHPLSYHWWWCYPNPIVRAVLILIVLILILPTSVILLGQYYSLIHSTCT